MRRPFLVFLMLLMLLGMCSCASGDVTIDYGESALYSKSDMDAAIKAIRKTFDTFDGCTLYSLSYAGDEAAEKNLSYCQSLSEDRQVTQWTVRALFFWRRMAEHGRQTGNIHGRGISQGA